MAMAELPVDDPHEVIHLGGQAAVVVPLAEYQQLRSLARQADAEAVVDNEAQVAIEQYQERKAAGALPPGIPQDEVRRQLGLTTG